MKSITARVGLAAALLGLMVGHAGAGIIINGSFEEGPNPGSQIDLIGGSTAITGWTVTGVEIGYIGTLWPAADGVRSLDLDGAYGTHGGIEQSFATTPGTTYLVSFDMAGNPDTGGYLGGGQTIKPMLVEAAGQSAEFFFDITGHSYSNLGWVALTWQFTAIDTVTTLQFSSLTTIEGWGPTLDNVDVVASSVPEPSTHALLLVGTLSSLGYYWRRRRRAKGVRNQS